MDYKGVTVLLAFFKLGNAGVMLRTNSGPTTAQPRTLRANLGLSRCSSTNNGLGSNRLETLESAILLDALLQHNHPLLVARRISAVSLKSPLEILVCVVGRKRLVQHTQPLAVPRDLLPVTLHILQVRAKVGKAALEDLAVRGRVHGRLEINKLLPRLVRVGEHKVGRALARAQERADLVRVRADESVVANVQDAAEAAAAQLRQLVDAQHLHLFGLAAARLEPLLELHHLHVLEPDARVDGPVDDALGHVHAHAHRSVVRWRHAVVRRQLVELDLAKLAHVADALTLERREVWRDARRRQVHDAREGLVEQRADAGDGEAARRGRERVDHGFEAKVDLARADDLGDILLLLAVVGEKGEGDMYAGVVGLEERNFNAFVFEVTLRLSEVQGRVVRGGVPVSIISPVSLSHHQPFEQTDQLVKKVILSVDIITQSLRCS